jgi:serine/threonine protein phosphatase PrpC
MIQRWPTDMISAAGGRAYNEDHCKFLLHDGAGCWALADGLGGHGGGGTASQLAVDAALQSFSSAPELSQEAIAAHVAAANRSIVEAQTSDPALARMASTLVILLSDYRSALWAHVGDSRLYHFRGGAVAMQTKDHSVAQALADSGDIPQSQIRFHPDRSSLRRSLGKAEQPQAAVLAAPVPVVSGDAFLLASDGFWEYVTETEMEIELSKAMTPGEWLSTMEFRLRLKIAGDNDNYSAIAAFVP